MVGVSALSQLLSFSFYLEDDELFPVKELQNVSTQDNVALFFSFLFRLLTGVENKRKTV